MDEDPDEDVENAYSHCLHWDDQTAQRSAANSDSISHSPCLRIEDQTAWRSAAGI